MTAERDIIASEPAAEGDEERGQRAHTSTTMQHVLEAERADGANAEEQAAAMESQHPLQLEGITSLVLWYCSTLQDLLSASRVCKAWNRAMRDERLWHRAVQERFGRWAKPEGCAGGSELQAAAAGQPAQPWYRLWRQLQSLEHVTELTGLCEDFSTVLGRPYTMKVCKFQPVACLQIEHAALHLLHRHAALEAAAAENAALSYRSECQCHWSYTHPLPRTNAAFFVYRELPAAWMRWTSWRQPGWYRRVVLREYERLPGSGPVDVPVLYDGVVVGPAVLGTFLLEDIPHRVIGLLSAVFHCGCFIIWNQLFEQAAAPALLPAGEPVWLEGLCCSNLLLHGPQCRSHAPPQYRTTMAQLEVVHAGSRHPWEPSASGRLWLLLSGTAAAAALSAAAPPPPCSSRRPVLDSLQLCSPLDPAAAAAADASCRAENGSSLPLVCVCANLCLLPSGQVHPKQQCSARLHLMRLQELLLDASDGNEPHLLHRLGADDVMLAAGHHRLRWVEATRQHPPSGAAPDCAETDLPPDFLNVVARPLLPPELPATMLARASVHLAQGGSVAILDDAEVVGRYAADVFCGIFVHSQAGRGSFCLFQCPSELEKAQPPL